MNIWVCSPVFTGEVLLCMGLTWILSPPVLTTRSKEVAEVYGYLQAVWKLPIKMGADQLVYPFLLWHYHRKILQNMMSLWLEGGMCFFLGCLFCRRIKGKWCNHNSWKMYMTEYRIPFAKLQEILDSFQNLNMYWYWTLQLSVENTKAGEWVRRGQGDIYFHIKTTNNGTSDGSPVAV